MELILDKQLSQGIHLQFEGEARTTDNFSTLGRYDAGVALLYDFNRTFQFGLGYKMIDKKGSSGVWSVRHRIYADARAALQAGDWNFSLKERLQLTHKDLNALEKEATPNSLTLKSRLQAAYKGFSHLEPYAFAELRNVFNDPACSATWNTVSQAFSDYEFLGYKHACLNRIRGSLGIEWELDKNSCFDFHILTDYCRDKEIDTSGSGTRLESLTWARTFYLAFCTGYTFSF